MPPSSSSGRADRTSTWATIPRATAEPAEDFKVLAADSSSLLVEVRGKKSDR